MHEDISEDELEALGVRYSNGQTTAANILRTYGLPRFRRSVEACTARSFHWLLEEVYAESLYQSRYRHMLRVLAWACHEQMPLHYVVELYDADMVARGLRQLRGTQPSALDLVYPEPEAAYAAAALLATESVEVAHA